MRSLITRKNISTLNYFIVVLCSMILSVSCINAIDQEKLIEKLSSLEGEWTRQIDFRNIDYIFSASGSGQFKYFSKKDDIDNALFTLDSGVLQEARGMVIIEKRPYFIFSIYVDNKLLYFGFYQKEFVDLWYRDTTPKSIITSEQSYASIDEMEKSNPTLYALQLSSICE